MRDLRKYWQEVRAMERNLPEFVWLVGGELAKGGGASNELLALVEVPAAQAAKLLHGGSHRLATEEEIAAHVAAQDSLRQQAFQDGLRRKGIAVVTVAAKKNQK